MVALARTGIFRVCPAVGTAAPDGSGQISVLLQTPE